MTRERATKELWSSDSTAQEPSLLFERFADLPAQSVATPRPRGSGASWRSSRSPDHRPPPGCR